MKKLRKTYNSLLINSADEKKISELLKKHLRTEENPTGLLVGTIKENFTKDGIISRDLISRRITMLELACRE